MNTICGTLITSNLTVRLLRRRESFGPFPDLKALRDHLERLDFVPDGDLSDFGRGGVAVRRIVLAALLTAGDFGGTLPEDTGVIGWNGDGCTAENLRFWRDYTDSSRESGRGGLFVATLPTIPFCEAAITLGCHGASSYLRTRPSTAKLFEAVSALSAGTYLLGELSAGSVCMLLVDTRESTAALPELPTLKELFEHLEAGK